MTNKAYDIVIVGGGLTGATLMFALENKGYKTLLIEATSFSARIQSDFDARTLALSPTSQRILESLNLWQEIAKDATAIASIEASRQFKFGRSRLMAEELGPLGYIVEMQTLYKVLFKQLKKADILAPATLSHYDEKTNKLTIQLENKQEILCPKLIVAADGTHSVLRTLAGLKIATKDYHQKAIVANIGLSRPHKNAAFERFTSFGPLALLPVTNNRAALVWALAPDEASQLLTCAEEAFLTRLQSAFGYKLGKFTRVGKRAVYPLSQTTMPITSRWPFVFIGNAAQTLHPVAGQGFNLGLRDVATLVQCIIEEGLDASMLNKYSAMRASDQKTIVQLTNGLIQFFSNQLPGFGLAQSLGLIAMDHFPLLQKMLVRKARGFHGTLPNLVLKGYHHE